MGEQYGYKKISNGRVTFFQRIFWYRDNVVRLITAQVYHVRINIGDISNIFLSS